jgi:integrase
MVAMSREVIEGFISTRLKSVRRSTVNLEIRHLKSAFTQAAKWRYVRVNPLAGVSQLRTPEPDKPRFLEREDIERLIVFLKDSPLLQLVKMLLLTGARLGETLSLYGCDIDMKREVIHYRSRHTKTARSRTFPFQSSPELRVLLEQQLRGPEDPLFPSPRRIGKPLTSAHATKRISEIMNEVGVPWATAHTLRHTFATHLILGGVDMFTVSKLLGHSTITITERYYAHLAQAHKAAAVGKLPYSVTDSGRESP